MPVEPIESWVDVNSFMGLAYSGPRLESELYISLIKRHKQQLLFSVLIISVVE